MIPNQEKTVTISGSSNLDNARSQRMGIDQNSLPHLMQVLTNLYSDKEMAVIREISTNAYDSHVEAGKGDVPIQVRLPNAFEPEFIVTDFGVGMSETEVFDVFGMYGASTKRESNDFVGQLGLGCKSPLTLTNQFALTTIKDGIKCIFSVGRDEEGVGNIRKMSTEETSEGNGVEISIPVPDSASFVRKARKFYRFFPVMPNFVGSANFVSDITPETILEIDDNIRVIKSIYEDQNDYVVMGGVAYPYRQGRKFRAGTVVMNAPIGAVDFTPSREDLHLTKRTEAYIHEQYEKVSAAFEKSVKDKLNSAKDIFEFHEIASQLYLDLNMLGIYTLNYKGSVVISAGYHGRMSLPGSATVMKLYRSYNGNTSLTVENGLHISAIQKAAIIVDDTEASEISSYTRGRLKIWMESNNLDFVVVVRNADDIFSEYRKKFSTTIKLTEARKFANKKINTNAKQSKYHQASVAGWNRNEASFHEAKPDESSDLPVVFAPRRIIKKMIKHRGFSDVVNEMQLFSVSVAQKSKFTKEFSTARQLDTFLLNRINEAMDSEMDENALLMFAVSNNYNALDRLNLPYSSPIGNDIKKLSDQNLVKALNLVSLTRSGSSKSSAYSTYQRNLVFLKTLVDDDTFTTEVASLTTLISKADSIGKKELDEAVKLVKDMQGKYPLLLHRHAKETYLVDYANMIAKGE